MNNRSELEWKRSVAFTMITPSSTSATRLSTVWETRVPSSTGSVSRIRPVRRASTIARAGSPRRAGSVADIRTPTIVAEATSRRRRGLRGSAAFAIENQALARRNIEAIISAVAISTQLMSERTMLATTWSTPIRRAAMKVRHEADDRRDAERRRGARCGGARGRAAARDRASAAAVRARAAGRPRAPVPRGGWPVRGPLPARAPRRRARRRPPPAPRPAARRSAARTRARRRAIADEPVGREAEAPAAPRRAAGGRPAGRGRRRAPSVTTSA